MELSAIQRRAVFAALVVVLAGLGWFLLLPSARSREQAGPRHPAGQARADPAVPAASGPAASAAAADPASPPPPASSGPQPGSSAGISAAGAIYQWLPFTPSGLASAARTVARFGAEYGTFSYAENASGYLAPMRSLISPLLAQQLAAAYSTPGVASLRQRTKQVSTGAAAISSLRAFGPSSITFIVAVAQQLADTSGRRQLTVSYAVTVTGGAGSWQVTSIELASAGNS